MSLTRRRIIRNSKIGLPGVTEERLSAKARCVAASAVVSVLLSVVAAQAGQSGVRASPDIESWIERLTNEAGVNCCAVADGHSPEDVEWDIGARHYRVKVAEVWYRVPDEAVIKGPNRLGRAIVWLYFDLDLDEPYIRCFLPGPAS